MKTYELRRNKQRKWYYHVKRKGRILYHSEAYSSFSKAHKSVIADTRDRAYKITKEGKVIG